MVDRLGSVISLGILSNQIEIMHYFRPRLILEEFNLVNYLLKPHGFLNDVIIPWRKLRVDRAPKYVLRIHVAYNDDNLPQSTHCHNTLQAAIQLRNDALELLHCTLCGLSYTAHRYILGTCISQRQKHANRRGKTHSNASILQQ